MMFPKINLVLKIFEVLGIFFAAVLAFWVGYQQLIINRQLVDADYRPLLEVVDQKGEIKLYNRGDRVINLEFIRLEPTDKPRLFTGYQHSIFPGDSVDLNVVDAIKQYLNQKEFFAPIYEIFFVIKTPSKTRFYQGLIPVRIIYNDDDITGITIDGGRREVTALELKIDKFTDLFSE